MGYCSSIRLFLNTTKKGCDKRQPLRMGSALVLTLWALLGLCLFSPCLGASWSYHGDTGPEYWKTLGYCNDTRQSPIDIITADVVNTDFGTFELDDYESLNEYMDFDNNGHGVTVRLGDDVNALYHLSGGGLRGSYVATQFHFHWGSVNTQGSEHTVDGNAYPAELHMVHYHSNYTDLVSALVSTQYDAVTALGFFIEVGPNNNNAFDSFLDYIDNITHFAEPYVQLGQGELPSFSLRSIMPHDLTRFYRYNGSLTVPSCFETVLWNVFEDTLLISQEQLDKFRGVFGDEKDDNDTYVRTLDNFRPTNPLYDRVVYYSSPANVPDPDECPTSESPVTVDGGDGMNGDNGMNGDVEDSDNKLELMIIATVIVASAMLLTMLVLLLMIALYTSLTKKLEKERKEHQQSHEMNNKNSVVNGAYRDI